MLRQTFSRRRIPFLACLVFTALSWAFGGKTGLEEPINNHLIWLVFGILTLGLGIAALTKENDLQMRLVVDAIIATMFALAFMPLAWIRIDLLESLRNIGLPIVFNYPIQFSLSAFVVPTTLGVYAWYAVRLRWFARVEGFQEKPSKPPSYVGFLELPLLSTGFLLH